VQFRRQDACLNCHVSYSSLGVPGMLVRSVFPGPDGTPIRELGDYITDDPCSHLPSASGPNTAIFSIMNAALFRPLPCRILK
jgi:hypothetical protein